MKPLFTRLHALATLFEAPNEADALRRARNAQLIGAGMAGLCLVLLVYNIVLGRNPINMLVLISASLIFVVASFMARRGHGDAAGRILVVTGMAAVVVSTIASGLFSIQPFYFALVLMAAGAVLRAREVLLAVVLIFVAILALWWELNDFLLLGLPPGALIVGVLTINGAAGLLAVLGAASAAHALRVVELEANNARRAEEALRESETYYRLIADNMHDLIALIDNRGRFLYASPSYANTLGYAPVMLVGRFATELLHPEDRELADLDASRARDEGGAQGYYRAINRAGEQRWLDMRMALVRGEGEDYLVVVGRDITERRNLEAQLRYAQKMEALGQLAGGVAHDFNNLLAVISGSAELAMSSLAEGDPAREDLHQVLDASNRAANLTRQLLAFARRQKISAQLISLADVFAGVSRLIERLVGDQIQISTHIAPDLWLVYADPGQIEQVIMNLAVNARDAMPNGGELRIALENRRLASESELQGLPCGAYVCLQVSDTGEGMSLEVQQRIFEPFFSTKGPDRGTGLGLATCYGIVAQSGGTIEVISAPGQGATFRVLLPAARQS